MSAYRTGPTELVILDPGYAHPHAHHQSVNLSIAESLTRHGVTTRIFAARDLEREAINELEKKGIESRPYFDTPCYPANAECPEPQEHETLQRAFGDELIQLYQQAHLSGEESLLVHTAFSFHYQGLGRALWHLRRQIKAPVLICPMFNPGAGVSSRDGAIEVHDTRSFIRHKLIFKLLAELKQRHGLNIQMGTSCVSYQNIYQRIWKAGRVSIHPSIGFREPDSRAASRDDSKCQVLLYFGGVKKSKGFEFAASLGATAATEFPDLHFVFHFNDDFPGARNFDGRVAELEHAGEKHDNVEILRGNLSSEAYDSLLQASDVVLFPYDPDYYRHKTSGVFWDALRFEKKSWIVTHDTWPQTELEELGIEHTRISFGNIRDGIRAIRESAKSVSRQQDTFPVPARNTRYLGSLMRPFGDWVAETIKKTDVQRPKGRGVRAQPSILVVRTNYGHFTDLSGPGGFVPYLQKAGVDVEEIKVELGSDKVGSVPKQLIEQLRQSMNRFLSSYQLNSLPIETAIQREAYRYDIVHFVDAEHSGLLSAYMRWLFPELVGPKLVATFHQPVDILTDLIADPSWVAGFDRIHLMAPDQASFFDAASKPDRLVVIPHGIADALLTRRQQTRSPRGSVHNLQLVPAAKGKKLLLTVGSWLRDFEALLKTARALAHRDDLHFLIVSKNLELSTAGLGNLTVLNQGITDDQLHNLYCHASLLFLPIKSGAANNAMLEAMANGLPIVSTDIPAVHYYSDSLANTAPPEPALYARMIEETLEDLESGNRREQTAARLRHRAEHLRWSRVAMEMYEQLYLPLLCDRVFQGLDSMHSIESSD